MKQETALPWKADDGWDVHVYERLDGTPILSVDMSVADRDYAIHAANMYQKLVAFVRNIKGHRHDPYCFEDRFTGRVQKCGCGADAKNAARAALLKECGE